VIVIPSLNTSRDVIVLASGWRRGAVQRAERALVRPGGKPLNVARFLGVMGVPCRLVVLADALLADETMAMLPAAVSAARILSESPSRTDVAIVDDRGGLTVFNAPPPALDPAGLDAALAAVGAALSPGDLLVIAGSQPLGAVAQLVELTRATSARLVVDASGTDLVEALTARPELVKLTAEELAAAGGGTAGTPSGSDDAVEAVWDDGRAFVPEARNVVVTRGDRGLRAWLADGAYVDVPAVKTRVVNPLGAGDAVTAALVAALSRGTELREGLYEAARWAGAVVGELGLDLDPSVMAGAQP